jgi:hypothetical protein
MDDHINNSDHDTDLLAWINRQVELLHAKKFDQLDLDNLIDEVNDMGGQLKRELYHRIEILLMHLLKYKYQPDHISGSWLGTIGEQRSRITKLLKDAPSLAGPLDEHLAENYASATKRAAAETGLPKSTFPTTNPFTKQQILDPDYLPD